MNGKEKNSLKKCIYKAGALILSFLLFFNLLFTQVVYAVAPIIIWILGTVASTALGYGIQEFAIKPIMQELGWTSADIQVDENGNVILSQAQMDELKQALEEYTQDANGNDKYGMYLYESTKGYNSVEAAMAAQTYDLSKEWNRGLLSHSTGHIWVTYSPSVAAGNATFAPNGAVWISLGLGYMVHFYNANGLEPVYIDNWYFQNNKHTWSVNNSVTGSAGAANVYGGPGHVAFKTIEGYREYLGDDSPYTLVPPTYTGGDLVIPKDQLVNPDNPTVSGNDFDDDGNPVTEKGWLQRIYERLGDILNQIKQIKWLTVVDVVLNAIDTLGDGIGNIASALVDAISQVFPLCILWDVVRIVEIFEAEPVPPVFDIPIKFGWIDETITIDLTEYETIFAVFRTFEIVFFLLGLFNITMTWVGNGDDVI